MSDVLDGLVDQVSLEQGYTLPSDWYTDDDLFRLERRVVFNRFWQWLGHVDWLPEPGTFFTATLGFLPVIVARDEDGGIRAFANVCQHRGTIVASGSGSCKLFQCPYHAWTYRLDGTLNRAPGMEATEGFDGKDFALPALRVEQWGPFLFATPDMALEPLSSYLGEFPDIVASFGVDFSRIRHRGRREYLTEANWKVVVENFLECYHCPGVHPAFSKVQDVNRYKFYGIGKYFTSQGGPVRRSTDGDGEASPFAQEGCYSFVWPNFSFNLWAGAAGANTMLWLPINTRQTLAVFDFYYDVDATEADIATSGDFIDQVQREDMDIVALVQQGLESGALIRGRLNLTSDEAKCEVALQHFQTLVYQTLRSSAEG